MVLGQPLHQRTWSLRLVSKVHHFGSHHQPLCPSYPTHPHRWLWQLRHLFFSYPSSSFLFFFVFYSDLVHGYMPLSLDSRKITFLCSLGFCFLLWCLQPSAKAWWLMAVTQMLSTLIYLRWLLKL